MARQRSVSRDAEVEPSGGAGSPKIKSARLGKEPNGRTGASKPSAAPPRGLVLVATPIGNAADITLRALSVLAGADVVACEDTRVTGKLLALHGVSAALTPYHEHNAAKVRRC